jgi:hypothetical protein
MPGQTRIAYCESVDIKSEAVEFVNGAVEFEVGARTRIDGALTRSANVPPMTGRATNVIPG